MSIYTYDGNKINVWPLHEAMEYARDAQHIKSGEFYSYINDLFGVYGRFEK